MSITSRRALVRAGHRRAPRGRDRPPRDRVRVVRTSGTLSDLQTGAAGPFDGATAAVQIVSSGGAAHGRPARAGDRRGGRRHLRGAPPRRPVRRRQWARRRSATTTPTCSPGSPAPGDQRGHRDLARHHRRRRRGPRRRHPSRSSRSRRRARSSSTRWRPTTTPVPPGHGWPASRWSGDAALARCARRSAAGVVVRGAVARGFMRLLTTSPEFSWSGTLFILAASVVAGACVGLVHAARVCAALAVVAPRRAAALVLFAGAGDGAAARPRSAWPWSCAGGGGAALGRSVVAGRRSWGPPTSPGRDEDPARPVGPHGAVGRYRSAGGSARSCAGGRHGCEPRGGRGRPTPAAAGSSPERRGGPSAKRGSRRSTWP